VNLHARENTIISDITAAAQKALGEAGNHVLDAYNIVLGTPPSTAVERAVEFVTNVAFCAPAITLAETWPGKSYVCHFNKGKPFSGLYEGRASHLLDTAYLWGNFNQTYPRRAGPLQGPSLRMLWGLLLGRVICLF
jgi:hypothetical protein